MKQLFRVLVFHITCIIFFSFIYYKFKNNFANDNVKNRETVVDFILLATTIQASVGITGIYPINNIGKLIIILQQFILISTHAFTIYIFNL